MGQQTKSTKSKLRKRRNDGGNRVVFIIAAVLMVIYLGGRLSNAFSAAPETTPALHVTVNDSFTSDGWFFRDEEPIDNATGSSVKHSCTAVNAYSRTHRWQSSIPIRNLWT